MPDSTATVYLEPTQESGRALMLRRIEGGVVMLNLLRFRKIADYSASPELAPETPISGEAAYQIYMDHTLPFLRKSGGGVIFYGKGGQFLIGPMGERWDAAMLVRQRSLQDFMAFASDQAYMAGLGHRVAALADSRLLPLVEEPLPELRKTYRKGALGALMDEYERAGEELARFILRLSDAEFEAVRDLQTHDEDCRSIQTVVHHVVTSGYSYALYLRAALSQPGSRPEVPLGTRTESVEQLKAMLAYTAATLEGRWEMPDEQISAVRIQSRWGETYDFEQMLEHAIVHVLRHRRQIERFLRA
jgi:uncharacterized damage-inducible protein DinB